MKYYESLFDDYIISAKKHNIHKELNELYESFSDNPNNLNNIIIYGPSGAGKYTQLLLFLLKFSPSKLKYENKIVANTEKLEYKYKISDIHYEIDMSLLGCNSKLIWHEIFYQIVDIISMKSNKFGFIVCKNFHLIHSELLEIFYSYIQQYNHSNTNITVKFIILSEHITFICNKIMNTMNIINVKKPAYENLINFNRHINKKDINYTNQIILNRVVKNKENNKNANVNKLLKSIDTSSITNLKGIKYMDLIFNKNKIVQSLPNDNFDVICNNIISYITSKNDINFMELRNHLYDMLTYNLDIIECIWYIFSELIVNEHINEEDISILSCNLYQQLKFYNNNYRPIYHLETIIYNMITRIK